MSTDEAPLTAEVIGGPLCGTVVVVHPAALCVHARGRPYTVHFPWRGGHLVYTLHVETLTPTGATGLTLR